MLDWIHLAQDRLQWRALVELVMTLLLLYQVSDCQILMDWDLHVVSLKGILIRL